MMVAISSTVPLIMEGVKDGILPVPLAPSPMEVLLFVQLNSVPGTVPLNSMMFVGFSLQ